MDSQTSLIDLNTAEIDQLTTLPGIDPVTANNIIAARPYESLDELHQISGLGAAAVEQIAPLVFLSPVSSEEQSVAETSPEAQEMEAIDSVDQSEAPAEALESGPVEEQLPLASAADSESVPPGIAETESLEVPAEQPETVASQPAPPASRPQRTVGLGQAIWLSVVSGALSFLFSIAVILGLLIALNGGLLYASSDEYQSQQQQIEGLESQVTALEQDLQSLRTRMDNLEGLSGRVTTVEEQTQQIRSQLDETLAQMDELNRQVSELTSEVEALQVVTTRFQNFLDGLRELLNQK